ncbi:hypothetical protein EGW08_012035 [Elysia chlorotica]|uniref:SGNH domain-containing protein n=1 Tax=Elysia chlorotica TaxID=188477 RepID=A0A3S1BCA6_ELYCH|nr:hypothetical protein EGW08_012035 [Elysia chlorotica]
MTTKSNTTPVASGNITFEGWSGKMNNLLWFRALCDPDGDYPCCYDNRCESRPVAECRCDNCYDLRQRVHAEFASWAPSDPTCQIHHFTGAEDTCLLLRNTTIYLIGDSFLRHLYTSLLALLRSNTYHGPLYQYSPQGMIEACDKNFVYLRMCVRWLDRDTRECDQTVKLKFLEYVKADQSTKMLEAIQEVQGLPNSLVVIGIGIHDDFNFTSISNKLIYPLLAQASSSQWPKVIWATTHAPGLLKSPRIPSQSTESIAKYNAKTKAIFSENGIPVFDTFELTSQAMSYDGAHFGQDSSSYQPSAAESAPQDTQGQIIAASLVTCQGEVNLSDSSAAAEGWNRTLRGNKSAHVRWIIQAPQGG